MNGDIHRGPMQNALRSLRVSMGLSQEQLARVLAVTTITVSRWERHGRIPRERLAELAEEALACSRPDLAHLFMDEALYGWIQRGMGRNVTDMHCGMVLLRVVDLLHVPEHQDLARHLTRRFTGEK